MEDIHTNFYNNVHLLTQAEPTTAKFRDVFHPRMFEKQNTPGLIHVSQFLLNIYDPEYCKKSLKPWPILTKSDEAEYRKSAKNAICQVAIENPDLDFPQILPTHFVHATGTIFMKIMSKLSTAVLVAYLKREGEVIPYCPRITVPVMQNAAEAYLSSRVESSAEEGKKLLNDAALQEEEADNYARELTVEIAEMGLKVTELESSLTKAVEKAPVHDSVKAKLMNMQNDKMISCWESSIERDIEKGYIQKKINDLREVNDLAKYVLQLFQSITSTSNVLDGNALPKFDTEDFAELPPELQIRAHNLYKDNQLDLHNFFVIFKAFLDRYWGPSVTNSVDYEPLCLQLEASSADMDLLNEMLVKEQERCSKLTVKFKDSLLEIGMTNVYRDMPLNTSLLADSPIMSIKIQPERDQKEHLKKLQLTPVNAPAHGYFSKYSSISTAQGALSKMPVFRINFDDVQLNKPDSPKFKRQIVVPKTPWTSSEKIKRYSRIFSTVKINKKSKANYSSSSTMSLPGTSKASSTMMNTIQEEDLMPGIAGKSFLNSTAMPCTPKQNSKKEAADIFHTPASATGTLSPIAVMPNEIEFKNKVSEEKQPKRRSISDLIDRYKKVLVNSSQVGANEQE